MMSAAASIEIEASAERVWQVIVDLAAYADWNPCFDQVRGALRSNDRLELCLRGVGVRPQGRSATALVLEVCRQRRMRWLVVPPTETTNDDHGMQAGAIYDLMLVPLGPDRVHLTQCLTVSSRSNIWPTDPATLTLQVEALNTALVRRVESTAADQSTDHPIAGTIRVSSRHGLRRQSRGSHAGLLACVAALVTHWPGYLAA